MDTETTRCQLTAAYNLILDADVRSIAYSKDLDPNLRHPMYFLGALFMGLYTSLLLLFCIYWDSLGGLWPLMLVAGLVLAIVATQRYIAFFLDCYTHVSEAVGAFRSCADDVERFVEFYNQYAPGEREQKFENLQQQFYDLRAISPYLTEKQIVAAERALCRDNGIADDGRNTFVNAKVHCALNPPGMEMSDCVVAAANG